MGITVSGSMAGVSGAPTGYSAKVSGAASVSNQLERMQEAKKKNQRPKKKLKYNPREIAGQLQRASKSKNAAVVLTRARSKVAVLQSAKASGKYKDSEVRVALAHARRMVNCSRMKVRNLKEEEILKGRNDRAHNTDEQKKKREIKRRVHQKEQDLKLKIQIEQNQQILKEKVRKHQLSQKQCMHRIRERGKILEADMKYLQKLDEYDRPVQSVDRGSAALELSAVAEQLAQLQMEQEAAQQMAQQIEQQVEMQVEMEMSSENAIGGFEAVAAGFGTEAAAGDAGGASSGTAVDVSV